MISANEFEKEVWEAKVDAVNKELASKIAAAKRSIVEAQEEAKLDQFGPDIPERKPIELRCGVTGGNLPTSEWSPTIGRPTAANSNDQLAKDCDRLRNSDGRSNYRTLHAILMDAYDHAATGKGKERHARGLPFDDQPMMQTTRLVGPGFPLGQAIKKSQEASGMIERGELDAAEAECLGAINYLAGAVAWMRERRGAKYIAPSKDAV